MQMQTYQFDDIIAPMSRDHFLAHIWGVEPVLLRQDGRDFDRLINWDTVQAILNTGELCTDVRVYKHGVPVHPAMFTRSVMGSDSVDASVLIALYREGASIDLPAVESRSCQLLDVVNCLRDVFPVSVNVAVTCAPPHSTLERSANEPDALVLQVHGASHWRVSTTPVGGRSGLDQPVSITATANAHVALDCVLRSGDVIHVPTGCSYAWQTEGDDSMHLTIGVDAVQGADFFSWLWDEVTSEVQWRFNAPLAGIGDSNLDVDGAFGHWANELKAALRQKMSEPDLFRRFLTHSLRAQPLRPVDLLVDGSSALPLESLVFERPVGLHYAVEIRGPDRLIVHAARTQIVLDGVSQTSIERLLTARSFTLNDLILWDPLVDHDSASELITYLLQAGVLRASLETSRESRWPDSP